MVTGTYYESGLSEEEEVDSDLETTINRLKKTNPLTSTLDEEGWLFDVVKQVLRKVQTTFAIAKKFNQQSLICSPRC